MIPRIEFFFPYREISGVPVLFSRMAKALAGRGLPVRIIDFQDGVMTQLVANCPAVEVGYLKEGFPVTIEPESLLIMQGILPATMRSELNPHQDTRLLFWSLHPMNWIPTLLPLPVARNYLARNPDINRLLLESLSGKLQRQLGDFLRDLNRHGSLLFMDGPNLQSVNDRLNIQIPNPAFLPVPSEPSQHRIHEPTWNGERPLRVGWIGRIADFKVHILQHTLEQVAHWVESTGAKAIFDIIGTGREIERLRADAPVTPGLQIRWIGSKSPDKISAWLESEIDLLVAMGTSALEGAGVGVPTLLLDIAYGPVSSKYRFRWLHEAKDFSLGDFVDKNGEGPGKHTFSQVLEELCSSGNDLSASAYRYVVNHHSLNQVVDRFTELAPYAQYRWGSIPRQLRSKSLLRGAYERARALRE